MLSKVQFLEKYNTASGVWPDNVLGEITPYDLRSGIYDLFLGETNFWPLDTGGIIGNDSTGLNGAYFNASVSNPPYKEGTVFYDTDNKTFACYNDKPDVTLQLGQEMFIRCVNKTGNIIYNGQAVRVNGAQGQRPTVIQTISDPNDHSAQTVGLATHDIPDNLEGIITTDGIVGGLCLSGYIEGDSLWLSTTISGHYTNVKPYSPYPAIHIGHVISNHHVNGRILVRIDDESWNNLVSNVGDITLPGTVNTGIKLNQVTPEFGWKDLVGTIVPRVGGGQSPNLGNFRGAGIRDYYFDNNDVIDQIVFHLPHDYYKNSAEAYIHPHWGHNGTSVTGNFVIDWHFSYAKGYSQEAFDAVSTIRQTISGVNISSHPQYYHNINELQFANVGGSGGLMDIGRLEVDGLLKVGLEVITIPTITGGTPNNPFIFTSDIHYQSTGVIGTINKNYPFYS